MKKLLLVLLLVFLSTQSKATHLMGGEITWECIKTGPSAGLYVFQLKIYRDCQGVPLGGGTEYLTVHNSSLSSIAVNIISITDLSPDCNTIDGPNTQFSCGGSNTGFTGNGNGAVEEQIYRSDTMRLIGSPDSDGWHFTWDACCRNNAITNISNPGSTGFTLRAVMYPYIDSLGVSYPNNNDCYDSSPKFYEKPRTILEVNNGYDPTSLTNGFTYSHNAFDQEQDSVVYSWGQPIDNIGYDYLNPTNNSVFFSSGFSYSSPINGISLNSITGRTSYPANIQGNYVTCTKVSAYKCGQITSEIFREIQIVLIAPTCNLGDTTNGNFGADTLCNVRPSVQPPFYYPASPNAYQWDTLVHCGDTVSFDFMATDNDLYANGTAQSLLFEVSGGQFYNYNDGILCQNPPCATFVESVSGTDPPFTTYNGTGTGYFEWITSCNHVINSCSGYQASVYTFVVRVSDDFCPAPAIENTAQVISITVYPPCDLKGNQVVTQPICDQNNGSIILNPSGGVAPYNTYVFDMNGFPVNPDSLYAGSYQIRITDSTLCETIDTIVLSTPLSIINSINLLNPTCNGFSNGSINISSSGGTSPYIYLWSNGDTTQSIQNLGAGQYIVSVTDSNNCSISDTILLTDPLLISNQTLISNVSCFGFNNGSIYLNPSSGVSPYTYLWNTGDSTISLNNLPPDTYSVLITDSNNCLYTESFIITEPTQLINNHNLLNPTCNGYINGSINLIINGGSIPYTYLWNTGDTTQNLQNIGAGLYSVIISDSNNCVVYDTINIIDPNPLLVTDSITNVSCFGSTNASVTFSLSGGTPGYIISVFGQTFSLLNPTSITVPSYIPIPAGNYPYSIIDLQGCMLLDTITITQPSPLSNFSSISYVTCSGFNNGSISINPSGGIGPYTYLWSTGDTTQFLLNIPSGQYFVSILDSNNCIALDTIMMLQPNQFNDSSSIIIPSCYGYNDGSVSVFASGGTAPYNYLWSTGDTTQSINNISSGQYVLSIIDSNSCILYDTLNVLDPSAISVIDSITDVSCYGLSDGNISLSVAGGTGSYLLLWNNGDTTSYLNNLSSQFYYISIMDSNSCLYIDSFMVMEPSILNDSSLLIQPTCNGYTNGNITALPFGSVPPYSYLWNTGDTSQNLVNITAGQYSVLITDFNNCIISDTFTLNEPLILTYFDISDSVSCFGNNDGSINLTINGGTVPYNYLWNTGDTTEDLSNIYSGVYFVNVLDANNCLLIASISVEEPEDLFAFFNLNYVSCFGLSDGNINGTTIGGSAPYSYLWNTGDTIEDLLNIPSDMYILSLTDVNNCFFTDTIVVFEPDELSASISYSSGALISIGTGGTLPYTYEIYGPSGGLFSSTSNNMGVSFTINPVLTGIYTLVVIDANGCIDSSQVNVLPSSIFDFNLINEINIYPNPSRDIFKISLKSLKKQDISISIFSLLGEQVYYKFINDITGKFTTSFDLNRFGKAVYLLEIKTDQFIVNKKIILE